MVEMQEVQHLPGGAFVRLSAVRALDALLGERFYVQIRVHCHAALESSSPVYHVDQQVELVFRRTALGFGAVIHKEARGRCQASLEHWKQWAIERRSAAEKMHSEVDDDAAGARSGR